CFQKVSIKLPRCGHSTTVTCIQYQSILSWRGEPCTTIGHVKEGVQYGPIDFSCTEKVTFTCSCGHQQMLSCQVAFDYAKNLPNCDVKEMITNPVCGHPCKVSCSLKKDIPITSIAPVKIVEETKASPFGQVRLPVVINCENPVIYRYKCGHEKAI